MNYDLNTRFMDVLYQLGLTGYSAAKMLETSETVISKIRNYKNKPSIDIIEKLLNNNLAVSAEYLMRGEGKMLRTEHRKLTTLEDLQAVENVNLETIAKRLADLEKWRKASSGGIE